VLAYDLLEPSTMHQKFEVEKKNVAVMRGPTFTTGDNSHGVLYRIV